MSGRIDRLLALMREKGLDAALVEKPNNIRYLTGYTGEGYLYVSEAGGVIITDFRYIEQARRQAPECAVERYGGAGAKAEDVIAKVAAKGKLAIELDYATVDWYEKLKAALLGTELAPLGGLPEELRAVKDAEEIALIARACEISCKAFDELLGWVRPGMTEKQVKVDLDYAMQRLGAEKSGFDTIACAGPNGSLPHAIATDRPIGKGELMTLDFGAQYMGYKADMTRTIAIGDVSDELRDIYDTVLEAQLAALAMVAPGVECKAVDARARDIIDAKYAGAFGHGLGHGVGLDIHEAPRLSVTAGGVLKIGQVVTVEPGVYIEGFGGCRIEDSVVVAEGGYRNLITAPKRLIRI